MPELEKHGCVGVGTGGLGGLQPPKFLHREHYTIATNLYTIFDIMITSILLRYWRLHMYNIQL